MIISDSGANVAIGACTDLLPGWYLPALPAAGNTATDKVAACTGTGKYCLGLPGLFTATANKLTGTAGAEKIGASGTALTSPLAPNTALAPSTNGGIAVCPTGFGNTATYASVDETSCVDISPGYYQVGAIGAAADLTVATATAVAVCPAGSFCPGATGVLLVSSTSRILLASTWDGVSSGTFVTTAGTSIAAAAANTAPNKVACPTGYTNAGGNTMVDVSYCNGVAAGYYIGTTLASNTANNLVTAVAVCPAGSYCPATSAAIPQASINAAGGGSTWNGATGTFVMKSNVAAVTIAANTSPNALACTTGFGVGGLAAVSAATGCNSIAPGYLLAAGGTTPAACTAGNYCLGFSAATGAVFAAAGNSVTTGPTAAFGTTACPTGTTWAGSASASATSAAVCDDLAAGYYIPFPIPAQSTAGAVTSLTTGIVTPCPAGYYCPYTTNGIVGTGQAPSGGIQAGTTLSTFTWNLVVAVPAIACSPLGTSSGATGATLPSACTNVAPGYYIDPSNLQVPAPCTVGEYCPGTGGLYLKADLSGTATLTPLALGAAGGDLNCPAGSVTPGNGGNVNNALSDCNLLPNYYIPSTATASPAIYLPVSCPAGYQCPGGSAIGAAGGSSQCPPNSTIPACTVAAVSAPGVTVAAGTAPAVNVAAGVAPNVTVTAPAITIKSAAPRAAAHAAVLALTALTALVAF